MQDRASKREKGLFRILPLFVVAAVAAIGLRFYDHFISFALFFSHSFYSLIAESHKITAGEKSQWSIQCQFIERFLLYMCSHFGRLQLLPLLLFLLLLLLYACTHSHSMSKAIFADETTWFQNGPANALIEDYIEEEEEKAKNKAKNQRARTKRQREKIASEKHREKRRRKKTHSGVTFFLAHFTI